MIGVDLCIFTTYVQLKKKPAPKQTHKKNLKKKN